MYRKNTEFLLPIFWSIRTMSSRKFIGRLLAAVYWLMPLFGRGINAFSSAAPSGSIGTTSPGKGALVAGLTGTTQLDATTGLKFGDVELHSLKSPPRILVLGTVWLIIVPCRFLRHSSAQKKKVLFLSAL